MAFADGAHMTVDKATDLGLIGKIKVFIDGIQEKGCVECVTGENGWLLTATDEPHLNEKDEVALYKKTGNVIIVEN